MFLYLFLIRLMSLPSASSIIRQCCVSGIVLSAQGHSLTFVHSTMQFCRVVWCHCQRWSGLFSNTLTVSVISVVRNKQCYSANQLKLVEFFFQYVFTAAPVNLLLHSAVQIIHHYYYYYFVITLRRYVPRECKS